MKNLLKTGLLTLTLISTLATKAQVPLYSSNPGASAVVFLDFDGHTVTGTGWNYNGPIICGASGFDDAQITTIFNRVAEDYRPFDINITTDSTIYLAAPLTKRMRVILTVSSSWYGAVGGVAFISSFTWGDDTPCFVFSAALGYSLKKSSEAVSHEAGHTLGLYHQSSYDANCNLVSYYNEGTGSGEIGWAPIMGLGYSQNFTLWNNGPNSYGCTNYQNDLDTITTLNGFSYRADDHAGSFAGATHAPYVSNQFIVNGIVERNTDQDMIRFIQPIEGRFQLNAIPYNVGTGNAGSNLDLQVTLYNSSQTELSIFNPGSLLNSVADTILDAGTYYLKVEGRGNIYAPNYASLGSYSLQGIFSSTTILPLRRLELNGQLSGDKHQLNWIIEADEQVAEQILEVSTDASNYSPVISSPAAARSFMYKPYVTTEAFYRIKVTFENGRKYYSNIVSLKETGSVPKPRLVTNLINTNTIVITSPGAYSYAIYDFNGKIVNKGQLINGLNNIDASTIISGMYLVRFTGTAGQWVDKLVRH
jgi:hypothetical protein